MSWDRDAAVGACLEALVAVRDLARGLEDDEWGLPTDLPGWSVRDNVAHVVAVEDELAGRPLPDHLPDYAALTHVTNPFAAHMEIGVDYRRLMPPGDLIAELNALIPGAHATVGRHRRRPRGADAWPDGKPTARRARAEHPGL